MKTSDLRYALSKLELLKRITDWNLRAESPAAGGYEGEVPSYWTIFIILWKKYYLLALDYILHLAQRNLKVLDF